MIRVLVADDQALVRGGFRVLVDSAPDLEVVGEAGDGTEAVALARKERPDVILMDIRMPHLDGLEATRVICGADETEDVRVLILTTFDLDEYVYAALRAGASGFLLKDTPPDDLLAGIRVVAAGDALLAPSVTRQLISEFVRRPDSDRPPPATLDVLTGPRARGADAGGPGLVQRGDRRAALPQPGHRENARGPAADQAAGARPDPARGHRLRDRAGHAERALRYRRSRGLKSPTAGSRRRVSNTRQAPESAEIRAQEEVRTQDEEAREDRGAGDERIQEALEQAAEVAEKTGGLGELGRPVNRRSPFMIGLHAAFGVAVAYGLIELFIQARSVLILIGLAFFIAAGLDPIVGWLVRHGVPRWAAVVIVIVGGVGIVAGFLAAAIPPLASEATALAHQIPHYLHDLQDRNSQLGKFNVKYHVQDRLTKLLTSGSGSLVGGVIGAGALVIGTVSEILAIAVLSIYFLAGLPQIKLFTYRLIPHSRRPRAILIGDEIFAKVGGYVLGNFITSVIAGLGTYLWLLAWGVPYPLLLGMFVAFLDLIPVIGSTIGGTW